MDDAFPAQSSKPVEMAWPGAYTGLQKPVGYRKGAMQKKNEAEDVWGVVRRRAEAGDAAAQYELGCKY